MPPGFYNCEKCGWSGSKLSYFGYDSEEKPMTGYDRHPQFGQGQCPNCRTHFEGCVHPDRFNILTISMTEDEIRALGEGRKTQVRIVIENCDPESMGPDPVDRPNPYKPGRRLMIRGSDGKIIMRQDDDDNDLFRLLLLDIVDASVDKLCNISPEDIFKEGIQCPHHTYEDPEMTKATGCKGAPSECSGPRQEMINTWDRDHPDTPWATNPWVWVITFKPLG